MKETKSLKYHTRLYLIPWAILLGGWLLGVLAGEKSETFGAWLLLASALLFGLPHGGYDFWILFDQTANERRRSSTFAKLLIVYLLLAILIVGVWYFVPTFALIGFLLLSAWHFGSGDAVWERENKTEWILNSVGRGLLLMSAPLAFYPNESGFVLAKLNPNSAELLIFIAPFALVGGVFLVLIAGFFAFFQNSKINYRRQLLTWLETGFLLLFFWLTTPLLAVTVYLLGVHSWRHLLRLNVYEQTETSFENNNLRQIISRFHYRAAPITIVSLIGLALIFRLWQLQISDLANYTSAYLILLSALTVPHAALITWTELTRQKSRLFNQT